MSIEIKVPEIGESITEGILTVWERKSGELVEVDDPLFELETDKVTMTISSQQAGKLETLVEEGSTVEIGQVVATIDPSASPSSQNQALSGAENESRLEASKVIPVAQHTATQDLAPSVRRLVSEHGLDAGKISGTGRDGRLTKGDVLDFLEAGKSGTPTSVSSPQPAPEALSAPSLDGLSRPQTRAPLSPIRKRIGERLLESQQSTATLTTFNEADMSNVIAWRKRYKEIFLEKHSVGLGFMSFFVKASVDALKAVPQFNSQLDGDEIVSSHFYDIGIAVGTERGLVVPILRAADKMRFAEIEAQIGELARRAQEKKLTLEELQGGCFTISNGGVYGSLLSTPILNPPQSGILGMHGIKRRPVAVGDSIEIRPMMYLAVSYDHRIVDGRESVTFLKRIVECIENPERMMLEI